MDITTRSDDHVTILTVHAERIDAAVAIKFKDAMRTLSADACDRVVLDLSEVEFIDSSGLGAIVAAMKLRPLGKRLEVAALTPTVDKVFRMTRMDTIFPIHDSADAAMAATP